jgi:nicotinate-nucleotide adenylyltransferase
MGADNLINFHKWKNWKEIPKVCKILVFDRENYKTKCLKSVAYKKIDRKRLKFIKFNKVNISSSQLRKI